MSVVSTANGSIGGGGGGGGSVGDDDILIHAGRQRLQISVNYLRSAQARAELGTWISDLNPSCPKK